MKTTILERIQQMDAYVPPPAGRGSFGGLLLDMNERTVPPSPKVEAALRRTIIDGNLAVYPEYGPLEEAIADYAGVSRTKLLATNGSDQAISLIFRLVTDTGDSVIIPAPSFSMFSQSAKIAGTAIIAPSYGSQDMAFPLEEVCAAITPSVRLIIICNPNNPTGTIVPIRDIQRIAKTAQTAAILVDEAYAEFSGVSAIGLISSNPNIIVIRTLSKAFGLAGLRLGYVVADEAYIEGLSKIRGPYDINAFASAAGTAALSDIPDMQSYVSRVMDTAKPMLEEYFRKNAIPFFPSRANFILFKPENADTVEKILRNNGVRVRYFTKPGIEGMIRVTVGTPNQARQFIRIYERYVLSRSKRKKYAFIDRDGTAIFEPQDSFQVNSVRELCILPGVTETLRELIRDGFELVMVTNQDGLGTPSNPLPAFNAVQRELIKRLKQQGVSFSRIEICPHLPDDGCPCRKPKTGLIQTLLDLDSIDTDASLMVGDRDSDRAFAENLGITFVPMKTNGDMAQAFSKAGFGKERP